jgi:hypothetical protein
MKPHPKTAGVVAAIFAVVVVWTAVGPLRPGWSRVANNGNAAGASVATPVSSNSLTLPFTSSLDGQVSQSAGGEQGSSEVLQGHLTGQVAADLQITLQGHTADDGSMLVNGTQLDLRGQNGFDCSGQLTALTSSDWTGRCSDSTTGLLVSLDIQLQADSSGHVTGMVRGSQA